MPKTVTADIAATERAILLFLSFFFSSFSLDNKSVNFTFDLVEFSSEWSWFSNLISELIYKNKTRMILYRYKSEVRNGSNIILLTQNEANFLIFCLMDRAKVLFHDLIGIVCPQLQ